MLTTEDADDLRACLSQIAQRHRREALEGGIELSVSAWLLGAADGLDLAADCIGRLVHAE